MQGGETYLSFKVWKRSYIIRNVTIMYLALITRAFGFTDELKHSVTKSCPFLSNDRCSLPKSERSVVTGVSVKMMRIELSILSSWFSYLGQCSRKCLLISSLLQRQRGGS